MIIVFLENKQIMYSFCNKSKYLHIKLGLNNGKCPYLVQRCHHQFTMFLMVCNSKKPKNQWDMVIVLLENKQIMYSFCNKHKYLHIKLGLNNGKCPYLVQKFHHQFTLFLMVCNSENQKPKRYGYCILRK